MDEKDAARPGQPRRISPAASSAPPRCPMLERIWSDATRDHFRNSRVEFLKGLRSLLDDRIAHLSREEQKGTRVTVE